MVAELPSIIAQGHRSLKVFMTYPHNRLDDEGLLKVLEVVSAMYRVMPQHPAPNHSFDACSKLALLLAVLTPFQPQL